MNRHVQAHKTIEPLVGMHALCEGCPHNPSCGTPCKPVRLLIAHGNQGLMEQAVGDRESGFIMIKEERQRGMFRVSSLNPDADHEKGNYYLHRAFSTENRSPFASVETQTKQAGIFIDRFFHGYSYVKLARKYETTAKNAMEAYRMAIQRVHQVIKAIETTDRIKKFIDLSTDSPSFGKFTKSQRWFLLNVLLGLRLSEIAEMDGANIANVHTCIREVRDRLITGEERFLCPTVVEIEEAEQRLEAKRARRRREHTARVKNNPAKVTSDLQAGQ